MVETAQPIRTIEKHTKELKWIESKMISFEDKSKYFIVKGESEQLKNFAIDALDFWNEMESVASELGTDCDQFSMLFAIQSMNRTIDRQRKTIAELRSSKKRG